MGYKQKRFIRAIQENFYIIVLRLLIVGVIAGVCVYIYNQYQIISWNDKVVSASLELDQTKKQLAEIQNNDSYKKYVLVKKLENEEFKVNWIKTTNSLIDIYDTVNKVSENGSNFQFNNFSISTNNLSMNGTVKSMSDIYITGGLLDSLMALDFVKYLSIPSYSKNGEMYNFDLTAKINKDGGLAK